MAQSFPTSIPTYADTAGSETLAAAGGGLGLSRILDDYGLDIAALCAKVGSGSATPAAGKVLRASGSGTSTWGAADLTTDVTGTLPIANGGTGGATAATAASNLASEIGKLLYPVGSIYVATVSTNPATLLGFGTWSAFGAGRTLVGIDAGQTEFDTVEETGGAKTHTLTTAEMPSHTHTQNAHSHSLDQTTSAFNGAGNQTMVGQNNNIVAANSNTNSTTATNQNTGGGGAHNNLQPYIVVYMWKRTA